MDYRNSKCAPITAGSSFFMRAGKSSLSLFEIIRRTNALSVWRGPSLPRQPIDMHFRCEPRPARYPEVSAAILAREDHQGSIFSGHPVKIAETAHPPRPVSSPGRVPPPESRTVALPNILFLPIAPRPAIPRRYNAGRLSQASPDPWDPVCSMLSRPGLGP